MKVEHYNLSMIDPHLMEEQLIHRFMAFDPNSRGSLKDCYQAVLQKDNYDRGLLSEILLDYNREIQNDEISKMNCLALNDPHSTVIITGQQPGLFAGPLYTIYKIITTLNLAKYCQRHFQSPVIPVFWNATEDHDLSEIASFQYPQKLWKAAFPNKGIAAEALSTKPACTDLVQAYLATISESNHKEEIARLIKNPPENYGYYSSRVIAKLFKGTGLVIMEPRFLRKTSLQFFQKCIGERNRIRFLLEETAKDLNRQGIKPGFEFKIQDSTGIFYINEQGIRLHIREKGNKFLLEDRLLSESGLLEFIQNIPERFSTGAYLRPIFQSLWFPNIAYVAGPSEFKYHLQLLPLFQEFNAIMPVIHPRNHATILSKKELKLASKLKLEANDYFSRPTLRYNVADLPDHYSNNFKKARSRVDEMSIGLYNTTSNLLSLQRIDTAKNRMIFELDRLEKKCVKEYLRRGSVDRSRLASFYDTVLPKNVLQERILSILYFIESNGLRFINDLIEAFDPFERRHYIIYSDH